MNIVQKVERVKGCTSVPIFGKFLEKKYHFVDNKMCISFGFEGVCSTRANTKIEEKVRTFAPTFPK